MPNETTTTMNRVTFQHPRSEDRFEAEMDSTTTGAQAVDELRRAGWLPDPGRGAYALAMKDATLDLARPLAEQGAKDGARVQVILTGVGAGSE